MPNTDNFQVSEKFGDVSYQSEYISHAREQCKSAPNMAIRLVEWHGKYLTEVFEPFKDRLRKNWTTGFQALMK